MHKDPGVAICLSQAVTWGSPSWQECSEGPCLPLKFASVMVLPSGAVDGG